MQTLPHQIPYTFGWVLSLFTLEFGGPTTYMVETHLTLTEALSRKCGWTLQLSNERGEQTTSYR